MKILEVLLKEQLDEVNIKNEYQNETAEEMQDFFSEDQDELIYKCKEKINED